MKFADPQPLGSQDLYRSVLGMVFKSLVLFPRKKLAWRQKKVPNWEKNSPKPVKMI